MRWTWDANRAVANLKKHKVSFGVAERVFDDPFAVTNPDPHPDEERWQTIGRPSANKPVVLLVVHTWPDDEDAEGRIISARKAEPHERKYYEEC